MLPNLKVMTVRGTAAGTGEPDRALTRYMGTYSAVVNLYVHLRSASAQRDRGGWA